MQFYSQKYAFSISKWNNWLWNMLFSCHEMPFLSNYLLLIFSNLETWVKIYLGALIFALIMISLVIMCIISLCVAKAQQGKGAQKYGPHTDVPGKHSRNFVRNVQPYERWVTQITIFQFLFCPRMIFTSTQFQQASWNQLWKRKKENARSWVCEWTSIQTKLRIFTTQKIWHTTT